MYIDLAKQLLALAIGFSAGLSVVYVFNRIPAAWLCDYHETPDKEMWGERIRSHPWTELFVLAFMGASLKLIDEGLLYLPAGIAALWALLLISLSDIRYRIIPDQFTIALAAAAMGFIPFQDNACSPLLGALAGGGSFLLAGLTAKWIFQKEALGFGDVKLLAAAGLIAGLAGIAFILFFTVFVSAGVFAVRLLLSQIRLRDEQPLGPFIAAGTAAYILFRAELGELTDRCLNLML